MTKSCGVLIYHSMYQQEIHIHNLQYLWNREKSNKIIILKVALVY